jgi:hypothetical protein
MRTVYLVIAAIAAGAALLSEGGDKQASLFTALIADRLEATPDKLQVGYPVEPLSPTSTP